ncbi:MAG TPA: M50 family metallopeptidase [Pyrinomonadaceae bacterium]|nr:M50 family metallopeptidase [Pyrinomonadaceae bacterium]
MKYKVAEDSRPALTLLLIATAVSIGLWLISKYLFTSVSYLVYPLQLFATFIHEGSHVLATVLTGNSVQSLTVSPDTSGVVWSETSGWFSQLLISSAGYLGTTAFGTLLLVWMRYNFSSRNALYFSSGFIALMTLVFGLLMPIFNILSVKVTAGSVIFTVLSGAVLAAGLFALARFGEIKWVNFGLAFLAVQCLLNALFSLVDLFFISATTDAHSDAVNMANSTGIPSLVWVFIWIGISIAMISVGLRLYAVSQKSNNHELPFED